MVKPRHPVRLHPKTVMSFWWQVLEIVTATLITTSLANTTDLEGHISELEEMHEVAEGKLVDLAQPTMILSRIDEIELPELDNAETEQP